MPVIRTDYTQINTGNYSGVKIQMLARLELRIFRMVAKWEYTFYNYNDWNVYKRGFFKVRIKNKSIYSYIHIFFSLRIYFQLQISLIRRPRIFLITCSIYSNALST